MANWNQDPIEKALSYWSDDPEAEFDKYKEFFATLPEVQRVNDLIRVDGYLAEHTKPTREAASLLSKRRQLEDIHVALRRLQK